MKHERANREINRQFAITNEYKAQSVCEGLLEQQKKFIAAKAEDTTNKYGTSYKEKYPGHKYFFCTYGENDKIEKVSITDNIGDLIEVGSSISIKETPVVGLRNKTDKNNPLKVWLARKVVPGQSDITYGSSFVFCQEFTSHEIKCLYEINENKISNAEGELDAPEQFEELDGILNFCQDSYRNTAAEQNSQSASKH